MRILTVFLTFVFFSSLGALGEMSMESVTTMSLSYSPRSATRATTNALSMSNLFTEMGLSVGSLICSGNPLDRTEVWTFKHRKPSATKGGAATDTPLAGKLDLEVLGYSEVGTYRAPSTTPPKSTVNLGSVTSTEMIKLEVRASEEKVFDLWGSLVIVYAVTQEAGRTDAIWVPAASTMKLIGTSGEADESEKGFATSTLVFGAFKKAIVNAGTVSSGGTSTNSGSSGGGGTSNGSAGTSGTGWQVFAGSGGGEGHVDGMGTNARFSRPSDVAVDRHGNVYVADSVNTTIRKITPAGAVSTLAGAPTREGGYKDGQGSAARFFYPEGIAVDRDGNVYVADRAKIRKVSPTGMVSTLAGSGIEGSADGGATKAQFKRPMGLCVDGAGNVYVADSGNHTIRKVTPGGTVSTIAGKPGVPGYRDGSALSSLFTDPQGVTVDTAGNIYVADGSGVVRKIAVNQVVSKVAGRINVTFEGGTYDGFSGFDASLTGTDLGQIWGISVDATGNLYIAANGGVFKVSSAGVVTTFTTLEGGFFDLQGITVDSQGSVYVCDNSGHTVKKIAPDGSSSTFAGGETFSGTTDGAGKSALFSYPSGMAVNSSGTLFIGGETVRQVTPDGLVTSLSGYGRFSSLAAVDDALNLYGIDGHSVKKVDRDGSTTLLAGSSSLSGAVDGKGANARFNGPIGMAMGSNNTLYIADSGNNTIRTINSSGIVTTLAGMAGAAGFVNGIGTGARFNWPYGVAVDSLGSVFVADSNNNRVRKIGANYSVTTFAGSGAWGEKDGVGASATLSFPVSPAVDGTGCVYVIDGPGTIRKITPQGVVSTLSDGGQFSPASLCAFGKYLYALTQFGIWRIQVN